MAALSLPSLKTELAVVHMVSSPRIPVSAAAAGTRTERNSMPVAVVDGAADGAGAGASNVAQAPLERDRSDIADWLDSSCVSSALQ